MLGGVEESNLLRAQTGSAQSLHVAFPYSVRRLGSRRERRSKMINITMRKTFDLMFSTFLSFISCLKMVPTVSRGQVVSVSRAF